VKVFVTDVIAISSTEPARLPALQVGGHSSLSNGRDMYRRAGPGCIRTDVLAAWAWRDMEMGVSCSWAFGQPGIG